VTNDRELRLSLAERGLGLTYATEPSVAKKVRDRRLQVVLDSYAPRVPGFFLYFPSRAQRTPALRAFVDAAKALAVSVL
jgi:DNA-binding transcriptional LysR family regulator